MRWDGISQSQRANQQERDGIWILIKKKKKQMKKKTKQI